MDLSWIAGPWGVAGVGATAAFTTALAGSGHCAVMCGPLACASVSAERADAVGPRRAPGIAGGGAEVVALRGVGRRQVMRAAWAWQTGRLAGYALVGGVLGVVGRGAAMALAAPALRVLPWLMAAGLVVSGLEIGKHVPPLPGIARIPRTLARWGARFSPRVRAAVRGAATPFLPCGFLYGAFIMAAAAGSVVGGALVMLAFGAGAVPALTIAQVGVRRLAAHPRAFAISRRAIPLLAAAVLIWRALAAGTASAAPPHCH